MVLLVDVVMDLVYVTVLLLDVVVLRSGDSLDPHQGKVWSGKKKKSELQESNQRPLDCCGAATTV